MTGTTSRSAPDCEGDVCRSEAVELPVDEVRVDRAMAHERRRDDAGEHVGDRRLRLTLRSSSTMRSRVVTSSVASAVTVSWKTGVSATPP
jgi:hypothetical protein